MYVHVVLGQVLLLPYLAYVYTIMPVDDLNSLSTYFVPSCPDLTDQVTKLNATVDTLQRTVDLLQSDVKKKPKDHKHATSMYVKMFPAGEHV